MIEAVIFDRDGVLVDSEYTNIKAAELSFAELGIELTEDEKKWIVGRHQLDYLIPFKQKYHFSEEKFIELQRKNYYEVLESTPVIEKTIELLKKLHRRKIPIALCTSSGREGSEKLLSKLNIKDLFTLLVTKEDYSKRKPDPDPYQITAKKLGLKPDECLVIEDSEVGLKSALAAGMKCIVIYNKYTEEHDFSGALKIVGSADEIELSELGICFP